MFEVVHFATGGTIDSHWDGAEDTAVPNTVSIIPEHLKRVTSTPIRSTTIFLKDSRKISLADQERVADHVTETAGNRILVTAGTYLMADIGRAIAQHPMSRHFDGLDRRVVLTGSVIPLKGYLGSDGGFNLGFSVAILQDGVSARVNIVMNGSVIDAHDARKDLTQAIFAGAEGKNQSRVDAFDLITVGGSIDFDADGFDGMSPRIESSIPGYLRESVRIRQKIFAVNPFVKDSRELSTGDFATINDMIDNSKTENILITTGLYKMEDMCHSIKGHRGQRSANNKMKRIIITGSRLPLWVTDRTDAPFNLGYALGKMNAAEPGVYIAMNGEFIEPGKLLETIFSPEEVRMLREKEAIMR